jgi:hypothetical protein
VEQGELSFLTYGGKRWLWIAVLSAIVLIISYLIYRQRTFPHGGTPMGLAYGAVGTIVILILMALGVRKRWYSSGLGTLQGWTSAHVYLGLLTLLLIPMHAGFKFRFDVHTLAFALLFLVVVSGMIGVVLYRVVPLRLTAYEQRIQADKIDTELNRLLAEMRLLARDKSDQFARVYQGEVSRLSSPHHRGWQILLTASRNPLLTKSRELTRIVQHIPAAEHADFQKLSQLIMQTIQLEGNLTAQMRLRNAMQAWLYVHVPLSFAMMTAIAIHLMAVLYY